MGFNFKIDNLAQTVDFLEKFNTDVSKILKKEMRSGANEVAQASRSLIPNDALSNWGQWTFSRDGRDLGFIGSFVRSGIVVETNRSRNSGVTVGFGYRVVSKNAGGAIFELAGSVTDDKGSMGLAVNNKNPAKNYPRTLFPAYYSGMSKAREKIEAALEKAKRMGA